MRDDGFAATVVADGKELLNTIDELQFDAAIVDTERMKHNLGITRGLIVAEAVMMGMAPFTGRQQAHDIVYDACRTVNEKGGTLAEALAALPEVTTHFDRPAIDRMTDPANYLGLAPQMVDRAVELSSGI